MQLILYTQQMLWTKIVRMKINTLTNLKIFTVGQLLQTQKILSPTVLPADIRTMSNFYGLLVC